MIIIDGGSKNKKGCLSAAAIGLLVVGLFGGAPFILVPFVIVALLIWGMHSHLASLDDADERVFYDEVPRVETIDLRLAQITTLRASIQELLSHHRGHPLLSVMDLEIRAEAAEIEKEAKQLIDAKKSILSFLNQSDANENEILRLEYDAKTEPSDRIRATLEATLERKRAELENVRRLTEQLRYLDALLDQAEATLAELHTRIGLAISKTEEYVDPRSRLALTEASNQLRSVSDAMRETLKEIA